MFRLSLAFPLFYQIHSGRSKRIKKNILKYFEFSFQSKYIYSLSEFNYLLVTMIENASVHENNRNAQLNEQPNDDIDSLRSFKQFACIFDAKYCLRYHDSSIDPALCAKAFTIWIRDVHIVLSVNVKMKMNMNSVYFKIKCQFAFDI